MKLINISVRDKIAVNISGVPYTCGNSDFVINFDFDAEWDEFSVKTARFIKDDRTYQDQVFQGNECPVPILYNTNKIRVGVFAGNLNTSTPAIVKANKGILCVGGSPEAPSEDVYAQILELLQDLHFVSVTGMTAAQVNALDGMFKAAVYDDSKNVSVAYTAFKAAFGLTGGGTPDTPDEPDDPDVPGVITYTITAELVNVTSSNAAKTVTENASYSATLTAADGYNLDSVSVLMGGVDVTADVYADGVISIPSVTGNVEIVASAVGSGTGDDSGTETAELPVDGLIGFWDLRNAATGSSSNPWYPNTGDMETVRLSPTYEPTCDDYGALLDNGTYGGASVQKLGDDGTWDEMNYGKEFTIVTLCYTGFIAPAKYYGLDGFKAFYPNPAYVNSDGSSVSGTRIQNTANTLNTGEYATIIIRVNNNLLDIYYNGEVAQSADGSDYDDFAYWVNSELKIRSIKGQTSGQLTALAVYDKALTEVEVVEMGEYLKTLEVTA